MVALLTIFDCDGVLVDSELIALQVLSDRLSELGVPLDVDGCRDAFMGRHIRDIVAGMERMAGHALPGEAEATRERMIARLRTELLPVPGVAAAVASLMGPRCVASSSDPARIRLTLKLTGLDAFFGDYVFSGMEVARGKPAPDLFLHAARSMGFAAPDCVVIEDSVMGVEAAVAAGMPAIGFTGGAHAYPGFAERLLAAGAAQVVAQMGALPAVLTGYGIAVRPPGRAAGADGR